MGKVDDTEGYGQSGGGNGERQLLGEGWPEFSEGLQRDGCFGHFDAAMDTGPKLIADRVSEISQPVTEQLVIFVFVTMHMCLVIYQCV